MEKQLQRYCKMLTSCSGCCTFLSPLVVLTIFPLPTPLLTVSVEATKWKSQKWFLIYCLMSFFPFVFFFTFGGSLRTRLETLVPSSTYFSSPFPFLVFWYPAKQTAYWILWMLHLTRKDVNGANWLAVWHLKRIITPCQSFPSFFLYFVHLYACYFIEVIICVVLMIKFYFLLTVANYFNERLWRINKNC